MYSSTFVFILVIETNIDSADDVDVITDFTGTTYLTIPANTIYWKLTFNLFVQQTDSFHVYVYGSESLCTNPNVALFVSKVSSGPSSSCAYDDVFENCPFDTYVRNQHTHDFCRYTCDCSTPCLRMALNIIPNGGGDHIIKDISWKRM